MRRYKAFTELIKQWPALHVALSDQSVAYCSSALASQRWTQ